MNYKDRVIELLNDLDRPITDTEIAEILKIPRKEIGDLRACLEGLLGEGYLIKTKKNKYGPPESFGLIRGRIQITQKGFGFLIPDDEEKEDIFIPAVMTMGAMNGDEVFVTLTEKSLDSKKPEGKVERIIKRKFTEIVGNFESSKKFGFVVPDDPKINQDIFISKSQFNGASNGQKVVAKILRYPDARRNPEGTIIEILGDKDDVGVDVLSIIKQHKLREDFPRDVMEEAQKIPMEIPAAAIEGRRDLRDELVVTIDGADAKDLDDAISLKVLNSGNYLLGVHIADVAQYVKEGTALDEEAFLRGTSVYLIDRVLPMLPEALSNGMCSLNPRVDRLTQSVEMEIDSKGRVVDHKIFQSVINSRYRLNYDEVSNLIEGTQDEPQLEAIKDQLMLMAKLSDILTEARYERGFIDFDFAESYIELDETGRPITIQNRERRVGHRLIESFMLAANETVAEHYNTREIPFLYRVHEVPTPEKIDDFNKFIYNFGYKLKGSSENIHPKAVQELIEKVKGTKEEHIISKLMLRSLTQARYYHKELGHFGLSAQYYSHFTSPIRRYPDLMIHRIIKEDLSGLLTASRKKHYEKILPEVGKSTSITERTAEKAERDVDDLKMAEYMKDKIGEEFKGMISSVTSFGFFVELENTVEGLVRMVDLEDDFYRFDPARLELVGERKKKVYRIGDEIAIKVSAVSLDSRTIDFQLA
ncbi:MAG: ribonuclease R [delta proteobacterium ML8_F1]|nr:MAG: ribonuclease R [delta proteobacterium ML8_F1]